MNPSIGYCTNVHAGLDLLATRAELEQHALAVKRQVCPQDPMGVGLWLSAEAVAELKALDLTAALAAWLAEVGLVPFTLNGFPYGNFHQEVVKHDVYRPTWCEAARRDYTLDLIDILDQLLPAGLEGSISTLPLMWGQPRPDTAQVVAMAGQLRQVAQRLYELEQQRGRLIYLCLEPEPGCVLERSGDVVSFFQDYLLRQGDEHRLRRYLRVCHDVCHAAVMFEEQAEVLQRYRAAGIGVGKVQVSSAVVVDWDAIEPASRGEALGQLSGFAEDRYLHQTAIRRSAEEPPVLFEDLPLALGQAGDPASLTGQWRVHFHVPIYLERFGLLETSRDDIGRCLDAARKLPELSHIEVETYAWGVLPQALKKPRLADGIADELRWLQAALGDWRSEG